MNANELLQLFLYFGLLMVLTKPLGQFIAAVYQSQPTFLTPLLKPLETAFYRYSGVQPDEEMNWRKYAAAVLSFNLLGGLLVFALQMLQNVLPLNPQNLPAVNWDLAFNTAVSFMTNTNWQAYGGETTLSYLTQMLGLTVQNFLSAATGIAVLIALIRGFQRKQVSGIGNFWVDMTRATLYILLPLSLVFALLLVGQGVVQTFQPAVTVSAIESVANSDSASQSIAVGPAASQIAIKQLGTNGGGFFNTNSAHPFENPTPLSNFLQMLAILLIPAALSYSFGLLVGDTRQGWAIFSTMLMVLLTCLMVVIHYEQQGNPLLNHLGISGGNMEGKEVRFGIVNSALWATATTAASNGSVNAMHDSLMPLSGLVPLFLIQLGEVIFGGVGSGLYGMLIFALIAVFIAGLMIGRTPEYLGKKIEAFEMKMAALVILIPAFFILAGTALAVLLEAGRAGLGNPGVHGFSEILYAFSSAAGNNGSAFGGLSANSLFYNLSLGFTMLCGRYGIIVPVLAIAGSLAQKKHVPYTNGTLPTHTPLFVVLLIATIILVGAVTFIPALALGPIVEQLQLGARL